VSFGGGPQVSGAFNAASARWLAAVLDSGPLQVPLSKR
jgi:preprotein translocase subunit SecD